MTDSLSHLGPTSSPSAILFEEEIGQECANIVHLHNCCSNSRNHDQHQLEHVQNHQVPLLLGHAEMTTNSVMNIADFPQQPRLERVVRHIRVCFNGLDIAETENSYRVLQAHRPPAFVGFIKVLNCPYQAAVKNHTPVRINPLLLPILEVHRSYFHSYLEYYLPRSAIKVPLTPTGYRFPCKWKGQSTHYAITGANGVVMANRAWSYESPNPPYEAIRGHVSFYARPWQCFVDSERVVPQRSDLRGGWVTSDITGIVSEQDPLF